MSESLSQRVQRIQPSATLMVSNRAMAMKAEGRDVIGLGAGEPDFDTPEPVRRAAIAAIEGGQTRYTPVDGTPILKQAIVGKLHRENDLHYETTQVLVSNGAKHSLFNAFMALVDPGDEVIIPAPYWVSYPDMTRLMDATPVIVPTRAEDRLKLTAEALEAAITPRTRVLVINSPANPTGQVYSASELEALGEVLRRHPRVMVLSDDIYEHIYWGDGPIRFLANVCPDLMDRIVTINGVSKAYAMTGWRIGYAAGPEWLIKAMKKVQGQSTTNACSVSQAAAVAALDGDLDTVQSMCRAFRERHDAFVAGLNRLPGFECLPGEGAFYAFPDVQAVIRERGFQDDIALAADILEKVEVALVPGTPFGAPGHLRAAYATSRSVLEAAIERLAEYLARR